MYAPDNRSRSARWPTNCRRPAGGRPHRSPVNPAAETSVTSSPILRGRGSCWDSSPESTPKPVSRSSPKHPCETEPSRWPRPSPPADVFEVDDVSRAITQQQGGWLSGTQGFLGNDRFGQFG